MQNKFYSLLGIAKRAGKISVGYNKCEESITYNKSELVIVSESLSENSLKKFIKACSEKNITLIKNASTSNLSAMLGNEKMIKIVSVNDRGFAKSLKDLWSEK